MILAFADDFTVTAFDSERQANTHCEGIDVENSVYIFTDELGFVLVPRFTEPNRRSRLFGLLSRVRSGIFALELTRERRLDLLEDVLANRICVTHGPTIFSTCEALQKLLRSGLEARG